LHRIFSPSRLTFRLLLPTTTRSRSHRSGAHCACCRGSTRILPPTLPYACTRTLLRFAHTHARAHATTHALPHHHLRCLGRTHAAPHLAHCTPYTDTPASLRAHTTLLTAPTVTPRSHLPGYLRAHTCYTPHHFTPAPSTFGLLYTLLSTIFFTHCGLLTHTYHACAPTLTHLHVGFVFYTLRTYIHIYVLLCVPSYWLVIYRSRLPHLPAAYYYWFTAPLRSPRTPHFYTQVFTAWFVPLYLYLSWLALPAFFLWFLPPVSTLPHHTFYYLYCCEHATTGFHTTTAYLRHTCCLRTLRTRASSVPFLLVLHTPATFTTHTRIFFYSALPDTPYCTTPHPVPPHSSCRALQTRHLYCVATAFAGFLHTLRTRCTHLPLPVTLPAAPFALRWFLRCSHTGCLPPAFRPALHRCPRPVARWLAFSLDGAGGCRAAHSLQLTGHRILHPTLHSWFTAHSPPHFLRSLPGRSPTVLTFLAFTGCAGSVPRTPRLTHLSLLHFPLPRFGLLFCTPHLPPATTAWRACRARTRCADARCARAAFFEPPPGFTYAPAAIRLLRSQRFTCAHAHTPHTHTHHTHFTHTARCAPAAPAPSPHPFTAARQVVRSFVHTTYTLPSRAPQPFYKRLLLAHGAFAAHLRSHRALAPPLFSLFLPRVHLTISTPGKAISPPFANCFAGCTSLLHYLQR